MCWATLTLTVLLRSISRTICFQFVVLILGNFYKTSYFTFRSFALLLASPKWIWSWHSYVHTTVICSHTPHSSHSPLPQAFTSPTRIIKRFNNKIKIGKQGVENCVFLLKRNLNCRVPVGFLCIVLHGSLLSSASKPWCASAVHCVQRLRNSQWETTNETLRAGHGLDVYGGAFFI